MSGFLGPDGGFLQHAGQLRFIALINKEAVAQKILTAMHLPTEIPVLHPARPPRPPPQDTHGGDDWLN